jgi:phosphorylcholine metabolism protein LicD
VHHILGPQYYYWRQKRVFKGLPVYENSEYVGPLAWYFSKPETVLFKREYFSELKKMKFEKYEFYVPTKFHEVLSCAYGDYMQLPPIEDRIYHHHYKAYKKQ